MAKGQTFSEPSFIPYENEVLTTCNRLDFAHSTPEELETLSQACQPASFGFNKEDVLNEAYRKAGNMD